MKKLVVALTLFSSLLMVACHDPKPNTNPSVAIEIIDDPETENLEVIENQIVILKYNSREIEPTKQTWVVDGKEISSDDQLEFSSEELGEHLIEIKVVGKDGELATAKITITVVGIYKYGTFILNEGNMTSGNGFLTFISNDGMVIDSVYFLENNSFLGNASEDLFIADNKIYIVSQNGEKNGGDGVLVVANAQTLKKEMAFKSTDLTAVVGEKETSLSWPTHVAVVGKNSYIRDNAGLYHLDLTTSKMTFVEGSKGASKNRMAVVGDKIFAAAGKNIYVIKAGQMVVTDTISLSGSVSGVIKSSDNNLWVSCTTSPAKIFKINASSNTIISYNELGSAQVGAGYGVSPAISAKDDSIYFSNATSKIYRHIFTQNKTEYLTDVQEYIPNAGTVYNNLAVNPTSGEVYFNTLKGWGNDYLINNITVFDFSQTNAQLKANYKNHTAFPAGIFFTENF